MDSGPHRTAGRGTLSKKTPCRASPDRHHTSDQGELPQESPLPVRAQAESVCPRLKSVSCAGGKANYILAGAWESLDSIPESGASADGEAHFRTTVINTRPSHKQARTEVTPDHIQILCTQRDMAARHETPEPQAHSCSCSHRQVSKKAPESEAGHLHANVHALKARRVPRSPQPQSCSQPQASKRAPEPEHQPADSKFRRTRSDLF